MGTGDPTDPTTTFFRDHREQCAARAAKLRDVAGAAALVAKLDEAVGECDAAIARGSLRTDMAPIVAKAAAIVTGFKALPAKTQTDMRTALKAEMPANKPRDGGGK